MRPPVSRRARMETPPQSESAMTRGESADDQRLRLNVQILFDYLLPLLNTAGRGDKGGHGSERYVGNPKDLGELSAHLPPDLPAWTMCFGGNRGLLNNDATQFLPPLGSLVRDGLPAHSSHS